jgi:VWFA-related protein
MKRFRGTVLPLVAASALFAQTPAQQPAAEMSQKDEPAVFRARVNLVAVPVVVRDRQGKAVGTLKQEDFQLFDRGKPQYIARFSVERAGMRIIQPIAIESADPSLKGLENKPVEVADGFTALVFDDVHIKFPDLIRARDAARQYLDEALAAKKTERFAIFTTSGQNQLDFTDDRDALDGALAKLMPHPYSGSGEGTCPHMNYYMADLIFNKHDSEALQASIQEVMACQNLTQAQMAQQIVEGAAAREVNLGDAQTRLVLGMIRDLIRRMAAMPGRRSMVVVSPGFITLADHAPEKSEIMDRAIRASVLINTLDARGLFTVNADASQAAPAAAALTLLLRMERESAMAQSDVLAELAAGTGASFFQNNNDLKEGFQRLSAAPEYYYLLAFSPQNLRMDGSFHALKVSLKNSKELGGMSLLARKGYYAPTHTENAKETERRELEEALFSREEMNDIPVDMHTQFFKSGAEAAKLALLIKLDVKKLKFRKENDRNNDELVIVCGVFDRNGVYVTGVQKRIEMRLKDETLESRLDNGMVVRNTLDVKPGVYTVRLVVRDAEGAMMSARNGAVEIPY